MKGKHMLVSLALGLGLALAVLGLVGGDNRGVTLAQSGSSIIRVALTGSDAPGCGGAATPCRTVQFAVDQAQPGEHIRVASGVYSDIQVRKGITQVVYISKPVTIRGGYSSSDWAVSDPQAHPTTLDAQGKGRVVVVSHTAGVALEGLAITGGDATGLGAGPGGYDAGGGVFAQKALTLTITGCHVYSNSARTIAGCCGNGGGLYLYSSDFALLAGNTIGHNWGGHWGHGDGGGVQLDRSHHVTLRVNTIHDNVGTRSNGYGGGLYLTNSDDALIDRNVFRANFASVGADARGGGVAMVNSDRTHLTNNVIQNNVASKWNWGYGGGVFVDGAVNLRLEDNLVVDNATSSNPASTGYAGGGLYLEWCDATLANTVIADNLANALGSGVYVLNRGPRFLHTTFARNSGGDGSAVGIDAWSGRASGVAFTNTMIVSHAVGITVTAGSTATLNGTLWYANDASWSGAGAIETENDHSGDPLFAPDGYHLTSGSAAIDIGEDAGVEADIDADARPASGGFDIGADEFWWRDYLPLAMRGYGQSD
jgi:hypothetical protein